jgi:hypothetical protein
MLPRRGLSRDSTLSDLRSIYERRLVHFAFFSFTLLFLGTKYTRKKWKHSAPELCGLNRRNYWRILSLREDFQPSFNPHAIMELLSDVPANHAENCLTLQEVSAVVTVMVARTSDRPFRDDRSIQLVSYLHFLATRDFHLIFYSYWFFHTLDRNMEE